MLKQIINGVYPISEKSRKTVEDAVQLEPVGKGTTFIKLNRRNEKEFFLLEGICRSFLVNPEGEEITISFYVAPSVLAPYVTRTKDGISILNFQSLTDIQLASIGALAFEKLMIDNIEIRNFGNRVLLNELIRKVEKETGLASLTAKERLLMFREQFPMLENLVPHTMIASYLGITNISLSRLRKDLAG